MRGRNCEIGVASSSSRRIWSHADKISSTQGPVAEANTTPIQFNHLIFFPNYGPLKQSHEQFTFTFTSLLFKLDAKTLTRCVAHNPSLSLPNFLTHILHPSIKRRSRGTRTRERRGRSCFHGVHFHFCNWIVLFFYFPWRMGFFRGWRGLCAAGGEAGGSASGHGEGGEVPADDEERQ